MTDAFIITCEHGGNALPAAYRALFRGQKNLLSSHRGYDAGALDMARSLAAALDAPMLSSTTSRLLVDLNRPVGHPHLFSEITRKVAAELRAEILSRHHQPYWSDFRRRASGLVRSGRRLIHVGSHSFAPVVDGQVRHADVGLLYDPSREGEVQLCARWKAVLAEYAPELRVRRNYPYYGKAPGLTSTMRKCFSQDAYVGIELEVNQSIVFAAGRNWIKLRRLLSRSFVAACA